VKTLRLRDRVLINDWHVRVQVDPVLTLLQNNHTLSNNADTMKSFHHGRRRHGKQCHSSIVFQVVRPRRYIKIRPVLQLPTVPFLGAEKNETDGSASNSPCAVSALGSDNLHEHVYIGGN
jgi:hypothetical protein